MTEANPTPETNSIPPAGSELPPVAPATLATEAPVADSASQPELRLASPDRTRVPPTPVTSDDLLPPEHSTRFLWQFVLSLDLSALLDRIQSRVGRPGAPAITPYLLLALWLQATADGISSSRDLAQLCREHNVYRWLCGGVRVAYHTLADFRTQNGEVLDDLLTQSLAALDHHGFLTVTRVAQDGMRTRGAAGLSSFRRAETIDEALAQAQAQLDQLTCNEGEDSGAASRRSAAARRRAATDRCERLERAQAEIQKLMAENADKSPSAQKKPEQIRVSTTDPECHKMKMADHGFRPAHNIQFATTTEEGVIVGVAVSGSGSDGLQMTPMLEQIQERCGRSPDEMLLDGGYDSHEAIEQAETDKENPTKVYKPVRDAERQQKKGKDPYAPRPGEGPGMTKYRSRMGTEEAKEIYKQRASTAELTNAQARNRGLYRVTVRGGAKVRCVALLYAIVHNFKRFESLKARSQGGAARIA